MTPQIHSVDGVAMRGQILAHMLVASAMFRDAVYQYQDRLGLGGAPTLGVEGQAIVGFQRTFLVRK